MVPFPVIGRRFRKRPNEKGRQGAAFLTDGQQRQAANQRKKRRECRYKTYLFKGGHNASPTQHLRMGKNKNGDSLSVRPLSDVSTEKFWDVSETDTIDAQRRLSGV